ncbi:MAG: apolipoprotein N-acyltransferase [Clostridia bacterium]|nr:apolipoprotein N-acyltransferase [Clostridia bacterium]
MNIKLFSTDQSRRRGIRFGLLALGAILTGLTLVFPQIGIIEWVSLIPAVIALIKICEDESVRRRGLYGYGFFFFMCFYLVNYHWFVNLYPLDFIDGMTKPAALCVVLAGWVGLSVLQSLTGGLVFVVFGEFARSKRTKKLPVLCALIGGALWAIFEWTQTLTWAGVPWGRLAIGQTGWLIGAQTASLLGSCFVTFLIVTVNFFAAYAVLNIPKRKIFASVAAGIFLLNTVTGALIYFTDKDEGEPVRISAVQGNISSQEKWDSSLTNKTLEVYERYTKEAAEQGARIVVWPESALPYNIESRKSMANFVSRVARENEVTVLVGAFTYNDEGVELNSVIAFLPDGAKHDTVYSKRHLVPFGEFVPMRDFFAVVIPPLTEIAMLSEDLAEGESANVMHLDEASLGSLICFDSIYDELARDSTLAGAEIITLSTNDSWFLDSAALYMHNAQAKLRAIENGRYVVRAANTGVSTVITPTGKTVASLDALVEGQITADVYTRNDHTLYTFVGNIFVYLCIIFAAVWFAYEKFADKILTKEKKSDII